MADAPHPSRDPKSDGGASTAVGSAFFPIPIDALDAEALALDLHLCHARSQPVLYRAKGSAYSLEDCQKLRKKGITHLFVPTTQHRAFQGAMRDRLVNVYHDPTLERAERTRIVRDSCGKMISDLMQYPDVGGISETIREMAGQFSTWCTEDGDKFSYLLDMSEHDYYTITHMVNVGVGCGLLATELLGPASPAIRELVEGGLVHDVGKVGVPVEILNKEGKLSDEEWSQIREHPRLGWAILEAQPDVSPTALEMTIAHHERLDGKGYPDGLHDGAIGMPARVCAVVDVYDALTAARPYRAPIPPRQVLGMMRDERGTAFDPDVFDAWERVISRLIERDPARTVPDVPAEAASLKKLVQSAPTPAKDPGRGAAKPGERIEHGPIPVQAIFVRKASRSEPRAGEIIDGMLTEGAEPELRLGVRMASGDVLRVLTPEGRTLELTVRAQHFASDGTPVAVCHPIKSRAA